MAGEAALHDRAPVRARCPPHSGTLIEAGGGPFLGYVAESTGREAAGQEGPEGELANPRIWGFGAQPREVAGMPLSSAAADIPGTTRDSTLARGVQTEAEREDWQGCQSGAADNASSVAERNWSPLPNESSLRDRWELCNGTRCYRPPHDSSDAALSRHCTSGKGEL